VHAVYEACGFGFTLQRQLSALSIQCYGAARKKAIVAVVRQLAVDLWRIKTGRLKAEQLGLSI
jgi:hypothetical protein